MVDTRTGRAASGGLVFALCSILGGILLPKPPAPDAGAATVTHYFADHHDRLLAGSTLAAVGAIALLPFFVALRARLASSRSEADTAFAAGIGLCTAAAIGALLQAGVTHAAARLDGPALVGDFGLERMVFYVAPPFFVAVLAAAVAIAEAGLPPWLRAGSGLLAVVAGVGAVSGAVAGSSAGTAIGLTGFGLSIVWVVCVSTVLLRTRIEATVR